MGRALFSQKYITTTPAVREEPEPSVDFQCKNWSVWNPFDPDSDEFFKDAQLEAFVEPPIIESPASDSEDEPTHVVVLGDVMNSGSSSVAVASSTDPLTDGDSPMAVGSDDPAALLTGAYSPADWQHRFLEAGGSDTLRRQIPIPVPPDYIPRRFAIPSAARAISTTRPYPSQGSQGADPYSPVHAPPAFIPPSPYYYNDNPSYARQHQDPVSPPRSPVFRRTVGITPINIPTEPSPPSPITPDTPSTPPPQTSYPTITTTATTHTVSPSPAPNVTPRIYTWRHAPIPTTPTRDTSMTNSRSRMSYSRIDSMVYPQQFIPVIEGRH